MVAQQKPQQILQLDPSGEIVFQGPFEHVVTSYLELKNPSNKRVCFKVKTTAPRRYCVRPNSGIVEPDGKIKIAIMLQPMDADSQAERNKHKFMVQSFVITGDKDSQQTDEIWQTASPDQIMDSKLRCVFHMPGQEQESPPAKETSDARSAALPMAEAPPVAATSTPAPKQQVAAASTPTPKQQVAGPISPGLSVSQLSEPLGFRSHHTMGDDYKIVLVSLCMLILGVILGRYII